MSLYRPTALEIEQIVRRGAAKWPDLASRWQRAAQILHADDLFWSGRTWRTMSQSDPSHFYAVDFSGCGCHDFLAEGARVRGRVFCKHKLALLTYCELMAPHIKRRLIGDIGDSLRRKRARTYARTLLLSYTGPDGRAGIAAYADERDKISTSICAVVYKGERGILPASEVDLYRFAEWLGSADPEPGATPSTAFEPAPPGWDALAADDIHWNGASDAWQPAD
jgi:hypothetical protein